VKKGLSTTREVALAAWDLGAVVYHLFELFEFYLLKKGILDKEWESFREQLEAQPLPLLGTLSEGTQKEIEGLRELYEDWSEIFLASSGGFGEPQA